MGVKRKKATPSGGRRARPRPELSTALLWGAEGTSRRRAKTALSLDQIVRTAIELADAGGLASVSVRRITERLGFTTMSLYRHVPGKETLMDLMRDLVFGEVARPDQEPGPWRAALGAWARRGRSLHERHPWLAAMSGTRRVPGPHAVAHYEAALSAMASSGLGPAEVVAVVELIGGFVASTARQAADTVATEEATGLSESEWWQARGSLFDRLAGYPALESIWRCGAYERPLDPFEFGLERLLDGVERLLDAPDLKGTSPGPRGRRRPRG